MPVREMAGEHPVTVTRGANDGEIAAIRQLQRAANQCADAALLRSVVGTCGAVKTHAIRDGDALVAQLRRTTDHRLRLAGT